MSVTLSGASRVAPSLIELRTSSRNVSSSVGRLSSGNRIARAADDVAALSVSTKLRSQVTTLHNALLNSNQASSMLQVADGGLREVGNILERMNALAVQANGGSVTAQERSFLNQEFQQLSDQINDIAAQTSFNGVKLLDGSLSQVELTSNTAIADKAGASLTFTGIAAGQTISINNVIVTAGTDFVVGTTLGESVQNLSNFLNTSTNTSLSVARYETVNETLKIEHKAGGIAGNLFHIRPQISTAAFTVEGRRARLFDSYLMGGSSDNGLRINSISAAQTITDSVVTTNNASAADFILRFSGQPAVGGQLFFDDAANDFARLQYQTTPTLPTHIQIGATIEETMQNTVAALTQLSNNTGHGLEQFEIKRDGDDLLFTFKNLGNPTDALNTQFLNASLDANVQIVNPNFAFGAFTIDFVDTGQALGGIDVSHVMNADFIDQVSGFEAQYLSNDRVALELTVGDETYRGTIDNTNPTANTLVQLDSNDGGFIRLQLAQNSGLNVSSQNDADLYATRINKAFDSITFYQTRQLDSVETSGSLNGASFEATLANFDNLTLNDATVRELGGGTDAYIELVISGTTYRTQNDIGASIGAFERFDLVSLDNGNESITLINGANRLDLSNSASAAIIEADLEKAFRTGDKNSLEFVIGATSDETISLSLDAANTKTLFAEQDIDILTQENAEAAYDVVQDAISIVTSYRATVGALQQQVDYIGNQLQSSMQNTDAARSVIADTDIASESTFYSLEQLKQQLSISMISQANSLHQNIMNSIYSDALA